VPETRLPSQSNAPLGSQQAEQLEAIQQLTEQNLGLAREIQNRSLPRLGEMCDALNAMAGNAQRGNLAAKEALRRFYLSFDEGRAAAGGIQLPNGVIPIPKREDGA